MALLKNMRIALRVAECVLAIVGIVMLAVSFESFDSDIKLMLGSPASNFALVTNYTALLYSLYMLVCVESVKLVPRFSAAVEMGLDGFMAAMLFAAAMTLSTSDYIEYCSILLEGLVRCANIEAAMILSFVSMGAFVVSLAIAVLIKSYGVDHETNTESSPQDAAYVGVAASTRERSAQDNFGANSEAPNKA